MLSYVKVMHDTATTMWAPLLTRSVSHLGALQKLPVDRRDHFWDKVQADRSSGASADMETGLDQL
jgi:hypothetical protein